MTSRPAILRWAALAASAAGAVSAAPAQPRLESFASTFEGRKSIALVDAHAIAKVELRRSDTHAIYTVSTTVRWTMMSRSFDQCGVVRFDGARIVPVEYVHLDHAKPKRNVHTRFDWARGTATTRLGDGTERVAEVTWPAWDPMSMQLALMAAAPSKRPGEQETHQVVERGTSRVHRVTFVGMPAAPSDGNGQPFAIRSDKPNGTSVSLVLDRARNFQPMSIGFEDVNLDRTAVAAAPATLPAGTVPVCAGPK